MSDVLTAEVAVPIPLDKTLTYVVPPELEKDVGIGIRVIVPVRSKVMTGFVTALSRKSSRPAKLKAIRDIADGGPPLSAGLLGLADWISAYYLAPLGEVLAAMSPPRVRLRETYRLTRVPGQLELEIIRTSHPERARIIETLREDRATGLDTIRRKLGKANLREHLKALAKQGVVARQVVARKHSPSKARARAEGDYFQPGLDPQKPKLTEHQRRAFEGIDQDMAQERFQVSLLLGVTGSGKTEVYLRCMEKAVRRGKQAIYLVPEIALTPQIMDRVGRRFGQRSALLHSGLSDSQRLATWNRIREGEIDVVVGARSAVFAPLARLGIVVVDEEHDTSYKQQDSPRYNAREVAIIRARQAGAAVILGSATPTMETYHNALSGKYRLYELPERIGGGQLPQVRVIDMRPASRESPLSEEAVQSVDQALRRGEQVLFFLNRRGFSNYIQCRDCGLVPRCRNCCVSLVYHLGRKDLVCHHCGYSQRGWQQCPRCGGANIIYVGLGTQRVEDYISQRFPQSACARFDRDATTRKGSTEAILSDFGSGLFRFMVGTQMLAKGHDFRRVGLVVVVNADVSMNLPDFRSAERTFQILTQVAGRAGRGDTPGEVIIQTLNPDHHSLSYVTGHDFKGFYAEEAELRRELGYPPFARLVRVVAEARKQSKARAAAVRFSELAAGLRQGLRQKIEVIGPSRAPISKVRNVYRWHLVLKGDTGKTLSAFTRTCLLELGKTKVADGVRFCVDVDPQVMI